MKKTLIALAAVAASGAALAQSSVTLYGAVDANITYVDGAEGVYGVDRGGLRTSRIGFKGTEDLGNGLKAEFVLEGALDNDDGVDALNFQRQSTIGLSGNFGTVRFGRELTASYNAVSRYDVFGTVGVGSAQHWSNARYANVRASNGIAYYTPKFSGFQVGVNLGFGEQTEARNGRFIGLATTYDNGPLSFGIGYDKANGATGAAGDKETVHAGGSYNFGAAKLGLAYKQTEEGTGAAKTKHKGLLVAVSAPVGPNGEVKASYNNYKVGDAKANQLALGYVHNLSKRTAFYGTYAFIKNKDGAAITLNGGTAAGLKNGKQHGFQVGLRHNF